MSVGVRQSILGKRFLRNFVVSKRKTLCRNLYNNSTTSSIAVNVNGTSVHNDETRVNKALRVYLESMKTQKQVMDEHKAHFDLGKRHLANMMGFDPDQMTQEDIDDAVEYLFPSGLTGSSARPLMKPPEELFTSIRETDFDNEGRPADSYFYTVLPRFNRLLSEINKASQDLIKEHDAKKLDELKNRRPNVGIDSHSQTSEKKFAIYLSSTVWVKKEEIANKFQENIRDKMYGALIMAFEHLIKLPGAYKYSNLINDYRQPLNAVTGNNPKEKMKLFISIIPDVKEDESGLRYATAQTRVKRTNVTATVIDKPGGYLVDGQKLDVFQSLMAREILLSPLIICNLLGRLDIQAHTIDGPGGLSVIPR